MSKYREDRRFKADFKSLWKRFNKYWNERLPNHKPETEDFIIWLIEKGYIEDNDQTGLNVKLENHHNDNDPP